jgi:cytochrome c-type biogenesis protein
MGLLLILDINLLARLPALQSRRFQNPFLSCFLYGLLYGPMTLPCSGPLIVGVFAYSTADPRSLLDGIVYVLAFGLGFGLPLLVLPFLTEATRKFVLQKMMVHQRLLARVAGVLLIGIGTIGFVKDWSMIRSYWGF